jgi:hypothetical protein
MSRYDDETQQATLDCLAANEGDYQATSDVTGVSVTTLRRWAKRENTPVYGDEVVRLRGELAGLKAKIEAQPLTSESAGDDMRAWLHNNVLPHLIEGALLLSSSIPEVIEQASLSQRVTALNQLLDKIMKLLALVPTYGEQVLRVEYVHPDGTIHGTPHWAEDDSE